MRKWTYLVAALLVGGATTTFTGCIDNDEPAGIEQLRGAKAEFIKAKAAYEDALTQIQLVKVEREQVALEADKVALDLQKLNLEKEQASTAWLKDYGKILGLVNVVCLEEVPIGLLRLVALAPHHMKSHRCPPVNRGVFFSISPSLSNCNGGFRQNMGRKFVTFYPAFGLSSGHNM